MGDIKNVIKWLREGKKVRRPNWQDKFYWFRSLDGMIFYEDGTPIKIHLNQIEAYDWEICEEESSWNRMGTDGYKWAKEFVKINKEKNIANDSDTMMDWFCNAIMAGYAKRGNISINKIINEIKTRVSRYKDYSNGDSWVINLSELNQILDEVVREL